MGNRVARDDYEWVYTDQPHADRRKEILGEPRRTSRGVICSAENPVVSLFSLLSWLNRAQVSRRPVWAEAGCTDAGDPRPHLVPQAGEETVSSDRDRGRGLGPFQVPSCCYALKVTIRNHSPRVFPHISELYPGRSRAGLGGSRSGLNT
ncbi:DEGS1 desaturase, partial [Atractosteus spatula]|nr:DEGS1 desaturase [Atractosteus spatula]